MDYYTRKQRERQAHARRARRNETIKTIIITAVLLPIFWASAVLLLAI